MRVLPYWPDERYVELAPRHWSATRARLSPARVCTLFDGLVWTGRRSPGSRPARRGRRAELAVGRRAAPRCVAAAAARPRTSELRPRDRVDGAPIA